MTYIVALIPKILTHAVQSLGSISHKPIEFIYMCFFIFYGSYRHQITFRSVFSLAKDMWIQIDCVNHSVVYLATFVPIFLAPVLHICYVLQSSESIDFAQSDWLDRVAYGLSINLNIESQIFQIKNVLL